MEDLLLYAQRMVESGRRVWGLDEQWDIRVKITPTPLVEEGGSPTDIGISFIHWPSKRATIEISPDYKGDAIELWKDILHELGHAVILPLWRTVTDWMDTLYPVGTKERTIFEDSYNSSENILIDHILFQILLKRDNRRGAEEVKHGTD